MSGFPKVAAGPTHSLNRGSSRSGAGGSLCVRVKLAWLFRFDSALAVVLEHGRSGRGPAMVTTSAVEHSAWAGVGKGPSLSDPSARMLPGRSRFRQLSERDRRQ